MLYLLTVCRAGDWTEGEEEAVVGEENWGRTSLFLAAAEEAAMGAAPLSGRSNPPP